MHPKLYDILRSMICPFDRIIQSIPERDGELLDIGSGYGTFCFILSKKRPGMKIIGVEMDKKRVNIANSRIIDSQNLEFICDDILNLSTSKRFDVITCVDLIHHIPMEDHLFVFRKINELLKDNGLLIVKDMDDKPFYKYLWNCMHDLLMARRMTTYYIPKRDMVKILGGNGFVIEYAKDIPNFLYAHYLVVCKRSVLKIK
ncbi:MAG: class I SAM-dependent methyltransferase [Bacteroidales bacterium]|nr:class I SAM-dependent methyltransferase [Bacteroidales bacterium]